MCAAWPRAAAAPGSGVTMAHTQTIARLWFMDREGTEDDTRLCYPTSIDPEAAIAASTNFYAGVVVALSDSPLSFVETEFLYVDDAPNAVIPCDLSQAGALLFLCEPAPDDQMRLSIPAMLTSCYLADGVTVDTTNAAVAALIAELLAPGAAMVCNPFESVLLSYEAGMRRTIPVEFPEATG